MSRNWGTAQFGAFYGQPQDCGAVVKKISLQCRNHRRCRFHPYVRKTPWRGKRKPTPVFLPGESCGHSRLLSMGSLRVRHTWTTEHIRAVRGPWACYLACAHVLDPLQCSCLENPRDGSLVGWRLWGHTESDSTDVTSQQQQCVRMSA